MELTEAKRKLQRNKYQRRLVYKLTYQKEDGVWKDIFFDDRKEAELMIDAMSRVNGETPTYFFITLNRWRWEMFIES